MMNTNQFGKFLIHSWLKSLKLNLVIIRNYLSNIEIVLHCVTTYLPRFTGQLGYIFTLAVGSAILIKNNIYEN